MGHRRLRVDMHMITEAMTSSEAEPLRFYLDLQEGGVALLMEDPTGDEDPEAILENPERYVEIPRIEIHRQYHLMVQFAEAVEEDDLRENLLVALDGRGAFRRFRNVVSRYPDLEADWERLHQNAIVAEAREWLGGLEIEPEYDLPPIEVRPARTPAPKKAEWIDLVDLLLLGAPGGKTELLDGRVRRQLACHSPGSARGIFVTMARCLSTYYGLAWRKRLVKGRNEFDLERAHLRLDGNLVVLEIEIPPEIWGAFREEASD